jgi:hypothetical protein
MSYSRGSCRIMACATIGHNNNATIPSKSKKKTRFLFTKGGDRPLVSNYRSVSLTSVVCKQLEHVMASFLGKILDKKDWLSQGQHGFWSGYSCESQVIMGCQNIADSLDNGGNIDAIIIYFSNALELILHDRLLKKMADSAVDSKVVVWEREFLLGRTQSQSRWAIIQERLTSRKCTGSATVPCVRK